MQFNLVKYRGAGFPVHQGPWWSGLLSGRRSYVYMHRGLTYCRSCGLSVLAIWNHAGEKCCEAFVFFSFKPFLSVLVFLYFPASRPLPSSFFFFFSLLSQCDRCGNVRIWDIPGTHLPLSLMQLLIAYTTLSSSSSFVKVNPQPHSPLFIPHFQIAII